MSGGSLILDIKNGLYALVSGKKEFVNDSLITDNLILGNCMIINCFTAVPQSQYFGLKASEMLRGEGSNIGMTIAGNAAQASTSSSSENLLDWVKQDKRRMLHVVYRVGDLDKTIKYVCFRYHFQFNAGIR